MSQLTLEEILPAIPESEPAVLSVSELNRSIRQSLEGEFGLIWLKGEISNFKPHTSGHFYFSLKDDKAQISAVMFRGSNAGLRFRPTDGMEVIVRGRVTVYEPRGNYQFVCELMEPVGVGALQLAFEQLKKKLELEGLFDPARKKMLPAFPQRIAIVTSPTGAAIRDMINVLSRRYRAVEVLLIPTAVQGANAPREIVAAIELANKMGGFDAMIVGRGGGSIEDLWAFNEESVARAIAASKIPTISAVGHEIDFTIADFVADLRAPTPSAAAELVVKNAQDLSDRMAVCFQRLKSLMQLKLRRWSDGHRNISARLVDPKRKLQDLSLRCDELDERLQSGFRRQWDRGMAGLSRLTGMLDTLSPLRVVERGYSIVTKEKTLVKDVANLKVNDKVQIQLAKGKLETQVIRIVNEKGVRDGL